MARTEITQARARRAHHAAAQRVFAKALREVLKGRRDMADLYLGVCDGLARKGLRLAPLLALLLLGGCVVVGDGDRDALYWHLRWQASQVAVEWLAAGRWPAALGGLPLGLVLGAALALGWRRAQRVWHLLRDESDTDRAAAWLQDRPRKCDLDLGFDGAEEFCDAPAVCIGEWGGGDWTLRCDQHCRHQPHDGHCFPLATVRRRPWWRVLVDAVRGSRGLALVALLWCGAAHAEPLPADGTADYWRYAYVGCQASWSRWAAAQPVWWYVAAALALGLAVGALLGAWGLLRWQASSRLAHVDVDARPSLVNGSWWWMHAAQGRTERTPSRRWWWQALRDAWRLSRGEEVR